MSILMMDSFVSVDHFILENCVRQNSILALLNIILVRTRLNVSLHKMVNTDVSVQQVSKCYQ